MLKHDIILGGEQSGHLLFLEQNTTGDGLVSALQVLTIMMQRGAKLSELANIVEEFPQANISVKVSAKPPLSSLKELKDAITTTERELGSLGRVLVRYSGTEDICRVMVEGPDMLQVQQYASDIAAVVEREIAVYKSRRH